MTAAELEKLLAELGDLEITASPEIGIVRCKGELIAEVYGTWPDADLIEEITRLIAMSPSLARKVIAAEKLAEAAKRFLAFAEDHASHNEVMPVHNVENVRLTKALAAWEQAQ